MWTLSQRCIEVVSFVSRLCGASSGAQPVHSTWRSRRDFHPTSPERLGDVISRLLPRSHRADPIFCLSIHPHHHVRHEEDDEGRSRPEEGRSVLSVSYIGSVRRSLTTALPPPLCARFVDLPSASATYRTSTSELTVAGSDRGCWSRRDG